MSQFYDQASLVMVPSGYKAGKVYSQKPLSTDGELTFTRNSNATRVNADGLVEKVRQNVLLYSQDFTNAAWAPKNGTLTANAATAPDGTNTATKLTAVNSDPYIYQLLNLSGTITFSCWVKGVGTTIGRTSQIRIGSPLTVTTFSLTADWQRVSVTGTVSGSTIYGLEIPNASVQVGEEVLIWGAQVEYSDFGPTQYIPTTSAAVSVGPTANVPRLDYSGGCPSLLLEPQRTNYCLWSEQISSTTWTSSSQINTSSNALVSPDGYQNADLIIPTTVNANHGPAQNVYGMTSGATFMCSIYAKAQGYSKFAILAGAGTGSGSYEFDLVAATASSGATISSVGNGWYRCSAPLVPNSGLLQYLIFINDGSGYSFIGDGTSGIAFWGAMVEQGAYSTSYIGPTLGASVTRLADAAYKTSVAGLIGDSAGFIYGELEGLTNTYGALTGILSVGDGTHNNNNIVFYFNAVDGYLTPRIYKGGSTIFVQDIYLGTLTDTFKFVISYGGDRAVCYVNGTKEKDVSGLTFFADGTLTRLGFDRGDGGALNISKMKQILIGTSALTDAQCIELTTL